jgi:hypothetical protein
MASDRVAPGRNWWDILWLLALVANRWNRCIVGSMGYWFINVDLDSGFHLRAICGSGAPRLEDRNEEPPITLVCLPRLFRICADSMCAYAAPNRPPKVIKPPFPKRGTLGKGRLRNRTGRRRVVKVRLADAYYPTVIGNFLESLISDKFPAGFALLGNRSKPFFYEGYPQAFSRRLHPSMTTGAPSGRAPWEPREDMQSAKSKGTRRSGMSPRT